MRRMLIIDDEPFIVNGLAFMLEERGPRDLEVHRAYSATEALVLLERIGFDLVLSDVYMPKMNGLELQKLIVDRWPHCKVIFLSGHDEFSYIKEAIRHQAVDYILKAEGDEAILEAVNRALESLEKVVEIDALLNRAQTRLKSALPLLQREALLDLLQGGAAGGRPIPVLEEAEIPLDARQSVLLLIGRIDDWGGRENVSDRLLMSYALQNVAEELLAPLANSLSISHERSLLVWFIQPLDGHAGEAAENRLSAFMEAALSRMQSICSQLLRLKVSFAVSDRMCPWAQVADRYDALRGMFGRGLGLGQELLLIERQLPDAPAASTKEEWLRLLRKRRQELETALSGGMQETFIALLREIADRMPDNDRSELQALLYAQVAALLLLYAQSDDALPSAEHPHDWQLLLRYDLHAGWMQALAFLEETAAALLDRQKDAERQQERQLVQRIRRYVNEHLAGDLSLTRIGEEVALNPFYLSRLFKQLTGDNITDLIAAARLAKAQELLQETNDKIQDIAQRVGFESAAYFNRFFKKATTMTPQEYRERNSHKS